jgi:hypothetical protein
VPAVQSTAEWEREPCLKIAELSFNLRNDNKIIPNSLNFGGIFGGDYILTPSLDAPLEKAVIWFTRVSPKYERRQFYNLKGVLNKYWKILKEQETRGISPA